MAAGKIKYRVLLAGGNDKLCAFLSELLPRSDYEPLVKVDSVGEVRRMVPEGSTDIVIINAPLKEEFGTQLALDLAYENISVLLLVSGEVFDQVTAKVEDEGVLTLAKPMTRQSFYTAIKLATAMRGKMLRLERKNQALQEKMTDIRIVNRAKWLLISKQGMTESDAHYLIEKQAMDTRLSRREIAEGIIRRMEE